MLLLLLLLRYQDPLAAEQALHSQWARVGAAHWIDGLQGAAAATRGHDSLRAAPRPSLNQHSSRHSRQVRLRFLAGSWALAFGTDWLAGSLLRPSQWLDKCQVDASSMCGAADRSSHCHLRSALCSRALRLRCWSSALIACSCVC